MKMMNQMEQEIPANANKDCVGPSSSNAGKAEACQGCPNQSICSSGQLSSPTQQQQQDMDHLNIQSALSNVSHVVLVLSGKGGVGKSTICCQVAHTLAARGYNVGVLDVDICGPSVAQMMGVRGRQVHKSASGWTPVYSETNPNISVMSVSFLLPDSDAAVIWRGPRKNGMIKQFLTETCWDDEEGIDYLLIDTPPGTSDEHISTVQYLQGALSTKKSKSEIQKGNTTTTHTTLSGAIVVTTPEEVSMADVRKELNFCVKTNLPVIGLVENMSTFQTKFESLNFWTKDETTGSIINCTNDVLQTIREKCPHVLNMITSTDIFSKSDSGPLGMAQRFNVPYLGALPLDTNLLKSCEDGNCFVTTYPDSPAVSALNSIVDQLEKALPIEIDDDDDDDSPMEE